MWRWWSACWCGAPPERLRYPARLPGIGGGGLKPIVWIPVALGLGLGLALADGRAGVRAWWTLRSDVENARERVTALRVEIEQLRREQQGLASDPFTIERAIRQDLHLARAGEVVVRIQLPSDPSSR